MQDLLIVTVVTLAALAALQATPASAVATDDWAVNVEITNELESHQFLQVHCKDRGTDFGIHQVGAGQTYGFGFNPMATGDYYCGFVFDGALHWFDIYIDKRDWNRCGVNYNCPWIVKEAGPCLRRPNFADVCNPWNADMVRRR